MRVVKDRKEFFSLLDSVSASNRSYFSQYGEWTNPQIKVFWLEVNKRFLNHIIENSGMRKIDKNMFMLEVEDEVFWIDTTDERIWELYTFAKTKTAEKVIGKYFTLFKGVDQLWFTEKFMESIQKHFNYHDRGFGIRYKDLLSLEKEMADFSAKFWLGKNVSPKQKDFLDQARDIFSAI